MSKACRRRSWQPRCFSRSISCSISDHLKKGNKGWFSCRQVFCYMRCVIRGIILKVSLAGKSRPMREGLSEGLYFWAEVAADSVWWSGRGTWEGHCSERGDWFALRSTRESIAGCQGWVPGENARGKCLELLESNTLGRQTAYSPRQVRVRIQLGPIFVDCLRERRQTIPLCCRVSATVCNGQFAMDGDWLLPPAAWDLRY